ncbi:hypothetical protein R1flu_029298 [Riccia fluitans]|uniref:Uncharacterized protein n=1 Tax=Riccia fluitans TaxID=41844 RepID=A0ABD1XP74_9MARC
MLRTISFITSNNNSADIRTIARRCSITSADLVLWYKGPVPARSGGKFRNRWFGPYVVSRVMPNNVVALETLDGEPLGKPVNVNRVKPYKSPDLPDVLSHHIPAVTRIWRQARPYRLHQPIDGSVSPGSKKPVTPNALTR